LSSGFIANGKGAKQGKFNRMKFLCALAVKTKNHF